MKRNKQDDKETNKKKKITKCNTLRKYNKKHPFHSFSNKPIVPFNLISSPLCNPEINFTNKEFQQLLLMEKMLTNTILDNNTPNYSKNNLRTYVCGHVDEECFEKYWSIASGNFFNKKQIFQYNTNRMGEIIKTPVIIYTFTYPNLPSLNNFNYCHNNVSFYREEEAKELNDVNLEWAHYRCLIYYLEVHMDLYNFSIHFYIKNICQKFVIDKWNKNGIWQDSI
ncbi:hypothetical protein ABK040_001181 [Willaertia magna]